GARGLGGAVLSAVFIAEGLWVYLHELQYTGTAVLWLGIGVVAAIVLCRPWRGVRWLAVARPGWPGRGVVLSPNYAPAVLGRAVSSRHPERLDARPAHVGEAVPLRVRRRLRAGAAELEHIRIRRDMHDRPPRELRRLRLLRRLHAGLRERSDDTLCSREPGI